MSDAKVVWKFEDGPEDAPEEGSLDDVGPAWLVAPGSSSDGDDLEGGEWITRARAREIASRLQLPILEDG